MIMEVFICTNIGRDAVNQLAGGAAGPLAHCPNHPPQVEHQALRGALSQELSKY
jgi:hypothetical protein